MKRWDKQGWICAADAADEHANSKDRKHTLGGVCVAIDSDLGAVIGKEWNAART